MKKSCLVLLAHGSRNPDWREPFDELLRELQGEAGAERVRLAYMQLASPSLPDVVRDLAAQGVDTIRVLPLLMSAGNHAYEDIPAEVATLRKKHCGVAIEILPPVGTHPRFKSMMRELVEESL